MKGSFGSSLQYGIVLCLVCISITISYFSYFSSFKWWISNKIIIVLNGISWTFVVFQRSTIHIIDALMKNILLFPHFTNVCVSFKCVLKTKFKNLCPLLTETTNPLTFIFSNANLIIIHSYLTFSLVYFNVVVSLFIFNLIHTLTYYCVPFQAECKLYREMLTTSSIFNFHIFFTVCVAFEN